MKGLFCTLLLILLPTWAQACIVGPEEATLEQAKAAPAGSLGFQAEILAVNAQEDSLPHNNFTAEAKIIDKFGKNIPDTVTLTFGPCSIIPEIGSTYYFLTNGMYDVEDHPSYILQKSTP